MYVEGEMPTTINSNGGCNSGFCDNGSWWVVIILFALIFGWGRNGNGVNGGNGSGAYDNYVLASDFATIQRQLGEGFSDMRSSNINLGNGIANLGYTQQSLINNVNTNLLQGNNQMLSKLSDCCCTIERGIDGVNYNIATQTNAIQNAMCLNTRDIIDNNNANFRAIHDELVSQRIAMKDEKIAEQQSIINSLQLTASQSAQNNYLINALRPSPTPSYIVANPYCCGCGNNGMIIQ